MSGSAGVGEEDRFDPVREEIQRRLVQWAVPSVSIAVARGDRILWEEGFCWADPENRRLATPHPLGAVSKPITATTLMGRGGKWSIGCGCRRFSNIRRRFSQALARRSASSTVRGSRTYW
jgi:hypothetical protein